MSKELTAEERKQRPIFSGVVKYFPLALAEIARTSKVANDQHNPGEPLHWDRSKSTDQLDACMRHLSDYARGEVLDKDGLYHLAKSAWRCMAELEILLEKEELDK